MAKSNLPSVDDHEVPKAAKAVGIAAADSVSQSDGTHLVEVKMEGYLSTNMVDINKRADTKLTRSQALQLRDKMRQLQDDGQTLQDGSFIRSKSDTIRWMIEHPLSPY
jgi:hypothetical protein